MQSESLNKLFRNFFHHHSLPRWMVFILDSIAVLVAFPFSYFLFVNLDPEAMEYSLVIGQSVVIFGAYSLGSIVFRSYAGLIRHTTIQDIFKVFLATSLAMGILVVINFLARQLGWKEIFRIPLSIILIHYVSINAVLFLVRVSIRMLYEMVSVKPLKRSRVIIFGAGSMGTIVNRVIQSDTNSEFQVIAFLDNNRWLQGRKVQGIPVWSPRRLRKARLEKYKIGTMIFAIQNIPVSEKAEIFKFGVDLGLSILEVPAVNSWISGEFQLKQLRRINVQDLLGRDTIELSLNRITKGLKDKIIMVTGAAGSIGSELVRQLSRFGTKELILIDNGETPMFNLENELRDHFGIAHVKTFLADVTDHVRMDRVVRDTRPDIIFHAAAYKHVPLLEENPHEAIRVNVGGTMNLTKLAVQYGIRKFVLVSTDNAVNPVSIMGASQRISEMIVCARTRMTMMELKCIITRFGNVLGSTGSVVPLFRKQIEEGGPVKVTHPEITRYFITIPEACQLVLEAGFMGDGGEVYVFDMGEPVKIDTLARQMIQLSGLKPDKDIRVEYTGLRPGEILNEELMTGAEDILPSHHPKIHLTRLPDQDPEAVLSKVHQLLLSLPKLTTPELNELIRQIVPDYIPSGDFNSIGYR